MHLHRQPNGKWRVQVRRKIDGEFVQKSKTFESKREAEAWGYEMEVNLEKATMTLSGAIDLYVKDVMGPKEARLESPGAERSYKMQMNRLFNIQVRVGKFPIESFGPLELRAYISERSSKVSASTVRKEVYVISGVYEFLIKDHLRTDLVNPARHVRLPVEDNKREVVHSDEDRMSLLNELNGEPRTVYLLLIETACRLGEVVHMRIEWVDLKARVIDLPATHTKTKKSRSVPLSRVATEALREAIGDRQEGPVFSMQYDSIRRAYSRARKRLGLEGLRLHDCRHTGTTRMVMNARNVMEVAKVTGHSTATMLERYTHLEGRNLHHLVD